MNTVETRGTPRWKEVINLITNPGVAIKNQMIQIDWPYSLLISGFAFTIFFLQTGIDMFKADKIENITVILITILGFIYGTAGIAFLGFMLWFLTQASKRGITIGWSISNFALGYSATLIYSITGLCFSIFLGWNSSVAFGVTGVLWALRPAMYTIKQMSGDKMPFSIILTTLCGVILLMGWALLGMFGM